MKGKIKMTETLQKKYMPEGSLIGSISNFEYLSSERGLERAIADGAILEAIATSCDSARNLTVDLGCMQGIIRRCDAASVQEGEAVKDIAIISRVGKAVCFKVLAIRADENGRPYALLSRKSAQEECMRSFIGDLIPGDIIDARVTHLEHFGAFVDIGCGIASLLSIDCISVSRISHPRDRFFVGMPIRVVIKSIDSESGRIFVSHKELLGTWEENVERFSIGQTVMGRVRSVEEYGIFIELLPNLAGLAEYHEGIKVGGTAAVYIKNIIPERMKIKLVIIDGAKTMDTPTKLEYFVPEGAEHIDVWRYSPRENPRVIETRFE